MSEKSFRKNNGSKQLVVLLCTLLLLLVFAPAASAAPLGPGDINSDGAINVRDVTLAQKHVLAIPPALTPAQQVLADVSGDGVINVTDVSRLMRFSLGLDREFPTVSLNVLSVTAVNARQVEVVFNRPVTKSLAENPANYEIYRQGALFTNVFGTAVNGAVANLRDDGRTVLLTLNNVPIPQSLVSGSNFNRVVVLRGVGLAADYINSSVAFLDVTAPTFLSVRSVALNRIELTFSEPVRVTPVTTPPTPPSGIQLSDGTNPSIALNFAGAVFNDAQRTVSISLDGAAVLVPGRTYTVFLTPGHNLEDYAANKALPASRLFTHTPVATTPSVTAAAINEKTVRLTFDRPVTLVGTPNTVEFRLNPGWLGPKRTALNMDGFGRVFSASAVPGSGGTQYDVQFADLMPMLPLTNTLQIHYTTTDDGRIVDNFGNVVPNNTSASFTVTASTTPVMVSAHIVTPNRLSIVYSRPVTITTTTDSAQQFVYKDKADPHPVPIPTGSGIVGTEIVSHSGNVIVVQFGAGAPFVVGTSLPGKAVIYQQSTSEANRVKGLTPAIDALSRDQVEGIAGF